LLFGFQMYLSIIIPLYNEEETITLILDQLREIQFPDSITEYEVIVVDDCSTDCSHEIVNQYIADLPNISLYQLEKNKGKGGAVRMGISQAKGDLFLIQDADLELAPSDIPSLVNAMEETKVHFVNGSRYLPGVNRPLFAYSRYLGNKWFTLLTALMINVKLTDMACAYKLFTRELYEKLTLKENGFGFEAELIIKAMRVKRNNISEVPVHYFPRNTGEGKKLKTRDTLIILWVIFKYGLLRLN